MAQRVYRVGDTYEFGDAPEGKTIVDIEDEGNGWLSIDLANGEVWIVEGTSGQDRESYSDDQDRENYT
ncbi:MAG TPA: hypothetical protein VHK27_05005 [Gammaproteobacteria bacterium]|nr:hypothetical protein [Gammaproteobacteria bacterium]